MNSEHERRTRSLSPAQLVALQAADAGAIHLSDGRLVIDPGFARVTIASVRACQRRGLLEMVNPVTGFFPLTCEGRDVLADYIRYGEVSS